MTATPEADDEGLYPLDEAEAEAEPEPDDSQDYVEPEDGLQDDEVGQ